MIWFLRKCSKCKSYTLYDKCPRCGEETKISHPPKFSLSDKYAKYRRMLKREKLITLTKTRHPVAQNVKKDERE